MPVKGKLTYCHSSECERPFSVNMIPHTNLIMIVADKTCPCFSRKISIEPTKVEYGPANETAYCERLKYNIYRRKPMHCMNYHPEVILFKQSKKAKMITILTEIVDRCYLEKTVLPDTLYKDCHKYSQNAKIDRFLITGN